MKSTDIFLCYRRSGAQTAKLFKRYLWENGFPASVWYSDDEPLGNYRFDIQNLLSTARCAVLFIDPNFTRGFQEEGCVTALEIVALQRNLMQRSDLNVITVFLDRRQGFSPQEEAQLAELFSRHDILCEDALSYLCQNNAVYFDTAHDSELALFQKLEKVLLPSQNSIEAIRGNFFFGDIPTSAEILVWDSDAGIAPEKISFSLDPEPIPLYRQIETANCQIDHELQNNQVISVTGLRQTLTDNEERKNVAFFYKLIEYRLFYKTLRLWNVEMFGIENFLSSYRKESSRYLIPNAMGLACMVITADSCLLFTQRSKARRIRPGEYDCSIVEGLKPASSSAAAGLFVPDGAEYLLSEVHRAFCEEVCDDDRDLSIRFFGVVLDKAYGQWNLVATVSTPLTACQIQQNHATRKDTFEENRMFFVPVPPCEEEGSIQRLSATLRPFLQGRIWGMALTSLYAALRQLGYTDGNIRSLTAFSAACGSPEPETP